MSKVNCWEFIKCGREKNGIKAKAVGICPVATESSAHGLNGGENGGRMCWVVSDVCCNSKIQCSDGRLKDTCFSCDFLNKVINDEGLLNVCNATGLFLQSHNENNIEKGNDYHPL